jgi:Rrf2 family transcriptional regulator, iron-sulfur cluster assembly transcription factor
MLRRESEYALEGLLVLARQPQGSVMLLKHVAQAAYVPAGFLARIVQKLKRHNLVTSSRGAVRGYALARPPDEITLREIFEAIEGPAVFRRCIFSSHRPTESCGCRLQKEWVPIAARLRTVMDETTLAQVASRSSSQRSGHRADRVFA